MIPTIIRIGLIGLRRDRVVLALTFLLPIMFFSIFANVFGNQRNPTSKINVSVVDLDQSPYSQELVKALKAEGGLNVRTTAKADSTGPTLDRMSAEDLVKQGGVPVAIILPKGLGESGHFFNRNTDAPKVQLLADVSDPIAPQVVLGLLQKVSFTAAPDILAREGMGMLEKYSGPLTPAQRTSMDRWSEELKTLDPADRKQNEAAVGLPIEVVNVMQPGPGDLPAISFYAAGIGVMFLLFSASGAGGQLLDEEESGTLGRLLGTRGGMTAILIGKWLLVALIGIFQLVLMFTWGNLVFSLPMKNHIPGFIVMTIVTAAAAAAFGLLLATLSRSRAQLSGISTIIILAMSAVGGSMFPRFMMTPTMQKFGLLTFNAWALDGYIKVFWRDQPVRDLWPQVLVLLTLCVVFLSIARIAARRWETT